MENNGVVKVVLLFNDSKIQELQGAQRPTEGEKTTARWLSQLKKIVAGG